MTSTQLAALKAMAERKYSAVNVNGHLVWRDDVRRDEHCAELVLDKIRDRERRERIAP